MADWTFDHGLMPGIGTAGRLSEAERRGWRSLTVDVISMRAWEAFYEGREVLPHDEYVWQG